MSTIHSITREALASDPLKYVWLVDEQFPDRSARALQATREGILQLAASALAAVAEIDLLEGDLRERRPELTPAHAYAFHLLAEHPEGLTHAQLFARWQGRSARRENPWPWISESGARTRVSELKDWGMVEDSGRDGRTPANRPASVWQLAADASWRPPAPSPEARKVLHALEVEAGVNVVTGSLLARLKAAGVAL